MYRHSTQLAVCGPFQTGRPGKTEKGVSKSGRERGFPVAKCATRQARSGRSSRGHRGRSDPKHECVEKRAQRVAFVGSVPFCPFGPLHLLSQYTALSKPQCTYCQDLLAPYPKLRMASAARQNLRETVRLVNRLMLMTCSLA